MKASEMRERESTSRPHSWEIVNMSDGRKVKRCGKCLQSYEFGFDLPCPAIPKEKSNLDKAE